MDDFVATARSAFESGLSTEELLLLSGKLQQEFATKLQQSNISMLPSYCHTLPTGNERGENLALDIGGTNCRIALVRLTGRTADGSDGQQIVKMFTHRITAEVRSLKGREFFDWLAQMIELALGDSELLAAQDAGDVSMGVAWSFPIEQTSESSGRLLTMGKEFRAADGIIGEDLTELIMSACQKRHLRVRLDALVNDGSATLLSSGYNDPNTRFGLILGTGTNASVMLPCSALHPSKFGERPAAWTRAAQEVLVNTEYSMFGNGALPLTRWDKMLKLAHSQPDFQPFEQMIAGRYLGELLRLLLLEAAERGAMSREVTPEVLRSSYSLDTAIMAAIEHTDRNFTPLGEYLGFLPSKEDLDHIHNLTTLISHRATALLAAAIHALWQLRSSSLQQSQSSTTMPARADNKPTANRDSFACNGSVIERYPAFLARTQAHVDALVAASGAAAGTVSLELAVESAVFGAAVAAAMAGRTVEEERS